MIEWKGLFANTPYSSANNKTQDDAVVGMQDTIYVTGPGYGGYSANVRVHNASGAVVALIPVSGGGGALSAPAPVRILDDSTTYSYSLEVVRGAIPSDDADKIAIRIVGGASKRYPGQGSTLPDGSTSFAGPVTEPFSYPRLPRRGRGSLPPNGIPIALQSNRSFIVRKPAPKEKTILRARVWVRHYGTVGTGFSNPAIITGIKVSGATQQAGAAGLGGTWKTVPFVGGAPTLEIPLGKDQDPGIAILPSEVCTDWVSLSPVARTDAPETYGDAPLFDWIFRTGAVAPAGPNITAAVAPGVSQFTGGWLNSATDWIATPPSSTPDQTYDASYIWIEYEVAEQTKSVGIFGDSLMDGENSSGGTGEAGYIQRAMTAMGINYSTWAQGGRVSSATQEEFLRWAFNYTFDAVFLTPVSINDVIRGVNIDTAWSDYLSLRQAAMARGVRVIAVSPMPGPATSTTMPGDIRQRLIAAGHEFFDAGIFVAADSTLAAWAAGYSGDGYHPNNTSTPILKAALEAWMANRL